MKPFFYILKLMINTSSAKLPAAAGVFDTLYQPSGRRAIRARHPNADPETTDPGISGICVQVIS